MNKQITLSAFNDELAQVRTKKKERTTTRENAAISPMSWN